jgi:uncharacterized protein YuzB (UPF0349 family)
MGKGCVTDATQENRRQKTEDSDVDKFDRGCLAAYAACVALLLALIVGALLEISVGVKALQGG